MHSDDEHAFQQAMQGVTPLKQDGSRLQLKKQRLNPKLARARQTAASSNSNTDSNPLTEPDQLNYCDPNAIGGERKGGVQIGVYRQLRLGKYPIDASLDLHRLTLVKARTRVHQFLKQSHQQNLRCLLITHGKGANAVMKSHTWHWLQQHSLVLAWHSAIPRHGGAGASYVLLRRLRPR